MLTPERVIELVSLHGKESLEYKSPMQNTLIEGLQLLHSRSNIKHGHKYGADHDILHADNLRDLPDLTEDDVIHLARCGFHFDDNRGCFARFV